MCPGLAWPAPGHARLHVSKRGGSSSPDYVHTVHCGLPYCKKRAGYETKRTAIY